MQSLVFNPAWCFIRRGVLSGVVFYPPGILSCVVFYPHPFNSFSSYKMFTSSRLAASPIFKPSSCSRRIRIGNGNKIFHFLIFIFYWPLGTIQTVYTLLAFLCSAIGIKIKQMSEWRGINEKTIKLTIADADAEWVWTRLHSPTLHFGEV